MRAIIINAEERTVSEAEINGSLKSLQGIVGGLIDPVYPGLEGTDHHCYVNDEGLLNNPQHFFMLKDGHQPLAGNGVILGDDNGDEAPATLPLDWVKERVTFMDLQAVREWVAQEPGQEVMGSLIGEDTPERKASAEPTQTQQITAALHHAWDLAEDAHPEIREAIDKALAAVSDAKAAKKEALAQMRAETEDGIAKAPERDKGNSRQ
jgi:Domain of unknown function (DUF3846)